MILGDVKQVPKWLIMDWKFVRVKITKITFNLYLIDLVYSFVGNELTYYIFRQKKHKIFLKSYINKCKWDLHASLIDDLINLTFRTSSSSTQEADPIIWTIKHFPKYCAFNVYLLHIYNSYFFAIIALWYYSNYLWWH